MRILWLCNTMLPRIAMARGKAYSNKEGWLTGLSEALLSNVALQEKVELFVAFPEAGSKNRAKEQNKAHGEKNFAAQGAAGNNAAQNYDGLTAISGEVAKGIIPATDNTASFSWYAFLANLNYLSLHEYDASLEAKMQAILLDAKPDVIHCFGTEYPHTLAMCRAAKALGMTDKLLLGMQGVCERYAKAYFADLPKEVINGVTLRDVLRGDSLKQQQAKYQVRAAHEKEAIEKAGNVAGRTKFDKAYAMEVNPGAHYFTLQETLRPCFYEGGWQAENAAPHTIFISQADYPLKGFHYLLLAAGELRRAYPDLKILVAGNALVGGKSLKGALKISAYGKYLKKLIKENDLANHVTFLGMCSAEEMKAVYLKSSVFVCCSASENSPNSLGEAMLLGMPIAAADVGGIPSMFAPADGVLYEGWREEAGDSKPQADKAEADREAQVRTQVVEAPTQDALSAQAHRLADAIRFLFENPAQAEAFGQAARAHARHTHDGAKNVADLLAIYEQIANET